MEWELQRVSPKTVFTVGEESTWIVKFLQRSELLPAFPTYKVMHYSNRRSPKEVTKKMVEHIRAGLVSSTGRAEL